MGLTEKNNDSDVTLLADVFKSFNKTRYGQDKKIPI